jgi:hypothetical protein
MEAPDRAVATGLSKSLVTLQGTRSNKVVSVISMLIALPCLLQRFPAGREHGHAGNVPPTWS